MKAAILTDTHFGARNDSSQFDIYFKKFYDDIFFTHLEKTEIKTVIHMGDVFDRRKYINFSILKSCKQYFFDRLKEMNIDMLVIPGNHDTYYKNTNEVNSLDLLLREYDNIEIIENAQQRIIGNKTFSFIPWICADNYTECVSVINKPADVCIGHFELQGFDMFKGIKNDAGMSPNMLSHIPLVLTGHFHHRSAKDNVYYLGSPYGFVWSDFDDPRGFHILDIPTSELSFIQNPNEMFHKIYYDDRKPILLDPTRYKQSCVKVIVVNKNDYLKFDKFIESLYINDVIELSVHDDFSDFEQSLVENDKVNIEDTMTLLSEFVDATETSKDKERLKTLLKTLYVEAQNIET